MWLAATRIAVLSLPAIVRPLSSNPNACAIALTLSPPSFTPSAANPVLHDWVSARIRVICGSGQIDGTALWMVKPPPCTGV